MNTYAFTTTTGGRVSIDAGAYHVTPDPSQVDITWNEGDIVYVEYKGLSLAIHASKDTVVIDGTSNAPGSLTGAQLYAALGGLFKKANSGSGGTGGQFTDAEVTKLKQLINVDNTAQ